MWFCSFKQQRRHWCLDPSCHRVIQNVSFSGEVRHPKGALPGNILTVQRRHSVNVLNDFWILHLDQRTFVQLFTAASNAESNMVRFNLAARWSLMSLSRSKKMPTWCPWFTDRTEVSTHRCNEALQRSTNNLSTHIKMFLFPGRWCFRVWITKGSVNPALSDTQLKQNRSL